MTGKKIKEGIKRTKEEGRKVGRKGGWIMQKGSK